MCDEEESENTGVATKKPSWRVIEGITIETHETGLITLSVPERYPKSAGVHQVIVGDRHQAEGTSTLIASIIEEAYKRGLHDGQR